MVSSAPIFVEVERIEEMDFDDSSIIDAPYEETIEYAKPEVEVEPITPEADAEEDDNMSSLFAEAANATETITEEDDEEDEDAFSAFLSNFKMASLSKAQKMEEASPIIEEVYPNSAAEQEARPVEEAAEPVEPFERKIKVPAEEEIIEAVVDPSLSGNRSSSAPHKFDASKYADDLDDGPKGFVPDYSMSGESETEIDPNTEALLAFRQQVAARREEQTRILAEERKEASRQANLVKELANGQKIVFEDTEELDNYAGFVPDYTPNTTNEEEFSFYKPRTVSDYSKYKKGKNGKDLTGAPIAESHMRVTSANEVEQVFKGRIPADVKRNITASDVRDTSFIVSMTGAQLTRLFNSWMMMNVTSVSVRAYETAGATADENFNAKIEGIKRLLCENFGRLDETFLDTIVRKYYNKYLDD